EPAQPTPALNTLRDRQCDRGDPRPVLLMITNGRLDTWWPILAAGCRVVVFSSRRSPYATSTGGGIGSVSTWQRERSERTPTSTRTSRVAPQHEVDFHERFSFRPYWIGGDIWGSAPAGLRIPGPTDGSQNDERSARQKNEGDPHLRSARFVVGHVVQASDAS